MMPIGTADDRFFSVELAKERLEEFMFFGLQERFQESMDLFSYQFGASPITSPPTVNIASDKSELSELPEQVLEKLIEFNSLDMELYEFGQKLFTKRYDEMLAALHQEYIQDEPISLHEILSREFCKVNRISEIPFRYEFEPIYQRSGWHLVERNNHQQWMWSGPETTSTVDLPLDRANNVRIRFQVSHSMEPAILESLELCVDGQRIHLLRIKDGAMHIFTGIVPENPNKKYTVTQFSFHVNRTIYPPGMTAESSDARLLGFALSGIEITHERL